MSSPDYHRRRVPVHPSGKRPFEECYDSDPDSVPTPSGSSSSSSSSRYPPAASPAGPESRNKRARSTSSTSTDASSTHPSTSSGYNTAQSSSRSDIFSDGPSASPPSVVDCAIHPTAPPPSQDVNMSDLHPPAHPHTQEDVIRTSLQRFAEFDRQIAALRTSLATRPSPTSTLGPSGDGDPISSSDHWHPNSSNFVSNGSGLLPPAAADPASSTVAVAPSQTLNSLPTFASSNDSSYIATATSATVPSASFTPSFSNAPRYPPHSSYRPSGSSSLAEPVGDAVFVNPTPVPAFMRPSSNENNARLDSRSSISLESSAAPSASHTRPLRRSLSPLVFAPDPSSSSPQSVVTDDIFLRYRSLYGDGDPVDGRSYRRGLDSPVPSRDREVQSRLEHHLAGQPPGLSASRLGDRARVVRQHAVEREPVPSVFDVFNISESSHHPNRRPVPVREPAGPRFTSIAEPAAPRGPGTHDERSRVPAPMGTAIAVNQTPSQDPSRVHSSWASIPSSNSLMSESASERRRTLALERFWTRSRRSSFDADDELDSRWSGSSRGEHERENSGDLGLPSPVPPVESAPGTGTSSHFPPLGAARPPLSMPSRAEPVTSTTFQRSFSDLFGEANRNDREEGLEAWSFDWDAMATQGRDGPGRERRLFEWGREQPRQRERSSQDVGGRSFASGQSFASTSSTREESLHPPVPSSSTPPRQSFGQVGSGSSSTTMPNANNAQQYSYSNLNLMPFQSGLFRDSLRRNAEVDQVSFSTSGPVMQPSVTTGDSRATSRLAFDDSGSEMDLDDFVRTRPPSPEWSRPQPYAGRTPPPDYSPPPRNFTLRPGFSVLRRSSMVNFDQPARPQQPNRNATMFARPMPPTPSGSTRPTPYENSNPPVPSERTERDRFLPTRLLETFYRSHEEGRRSASGGAGQPYHPPNQNHALAPGPGAVSRNDAPVGPRGANASGNRAGSGGSLGSIRSRLARFASTQPPGSATNAASSARARSPPRPLGARPQAAERRRGSMVFGSSAFEYDVRPETRSVSGPPHWAVNGGAAEPPTVARDAPWRAPSGTRNAFVSPPLPPQAASGSARESAEEHRSRLRTIRQRLQLDRSGGIFRPGMLRAAMGRRGNMGDYVPDELFDDSYEALLSLSSMLGEVRSKATPEEVITSLPTGTFKEWKRDDSETRCPICLDDYEPEDTLTKLIECTHWLHKNCLEQWLRTANTCPVCREKVKSSPKPAPARRRPYRDSSAPSEPNQASSSGNGPSSRAPQSNAGRPVSFAIMFDRFVAEGRDGTSESWSSPPAIPPPPRDAQAMLEMARMQRQRQQHAREPHQVQHDTYAEVPPPHELPYHLRAARPTSRQGGGGDGPAGRPFGFSSFLRGQGSNSSASSNSSTNMAVDDLGGHRRSMTVPSGGGSGSNSGLFFDVPPMPMPRRETGFPMVPPPPPSSGFNGVGGAPLLLPPPPPPPQQQQQQQTSMMFDARPTTVVVSSSNEVDWRARGYDTLSDVQARSMLSSSSAPPLPPPHPRPMSVANRIPIDEDELSGDPMFGWRGYRRVGAGAYPTSGFEEEGRRAT